MANSVTAVWTSGSMMASTNLDSGESSSGTLDLNGSGYDMVHIQPEVAFGATPDSTTTIEVFASTDQTTTTIDTIALSTVDVTEETSTTKRVSLLITDVPYVSCQITNNDSADTITCQIRYAARKWTSG